MFAILIKFIAEVGRYSYHGNYKHRLLKVEMTKQNTQVKKINIPELLSQCKTQQILY